MFCDPHIGEYQKTQLVLKIVVMQLFSSKTQNSIFPCNSQSEIFVFVKEYFINASMVLCIASKSSESELSEKCYHYRYIWIIKVFFPAISGLISATKVSIKSVIFTDELWISKSLILARV